MNHLNKVDWAQLGYPDLSSQFQQLTSETKTVRDEAYKVIFSYDLNYVTNLSPYLAPYLVDLLKTPNINDKDMILSTLIYWAMDSKGAMKETVYHPVVPKTLIEIKKGIEVYQNISENHEGKETRITAQQLLDVLSDNY